jgi:hypothetical protein
MSLLAAFVGTSGLVDMGYRFYNIDETVNGSRITTGIVDGGNGWYSVNATIPGGATSVRWDSTGTASAVAREYFYDYADPPGVTTLLTRIPSALTITAGAVNVNDKTGFSLSTAGVDAVWAKTMTELSAVPGVTASTLSALQWIFLLARNKITQTTTTQTLRNDADSAAIGAAPVSDDGTTFTRGEFA